jgi:hypothetical protein
VNPAITDILKRLEAVTGDVRFIPSEAFGHALAVAVSRGVDDLRITDITEGPFYPLPVYRAFLRRSNELGSRSGRFYRDVVGELVQNGVKSLRQQVDFSWGIYGGRNAVLSQEADNQTPFALVSLRVEVIAKAGVVQEQYELLDGVRSLKGLVALRRVVRRRVSETALDAPEFREAFLTELDNGGPELLERAEFLTSMKAKNEMWKRFLTYVEDVLGHNFGLA